MHISRLGVRHLRNLTEVDLQPGPGLNLIYGDNASGKTSLLESIHLAGLARSFRSNRTRQLIQFGHDSLMLFTQISDVTTHRIGLQRSIDEKTQLKVDGNFARSSSAAASLLPLQLITPEGHELITDSPKSRRQFIDWGLFHVEHDFHKYWQQFERTLKQRNSLLKQSNDRVVIRGWDKGLIDNALVVDSYRREYVDAFTLNAREMSAALLPSLDIQFKYHSGWSQEKDFAQLLTERLDQDMERGFTSIGPHRAELRILVDGKDSASVLSRGQQKLLVCALRIAQVELLNQQRGKSSVILIDDLPAELDQQHRKILTQLLQQTGMQVFITTTDLELIPVDGWKDAKVFHVEHGSIAEVV